MQALRQDVPIHAGLRLFQGGARGELLVVQAGVPQQGLLSQGQGGRRRVQPGRKLANHRPTIMVSRI